jgi:hypothetical protein
MIFHKSILSGAIEIARSERSNELYRGVLLQRDGTVISASENARFIAEAAHAELPFVKTGALRENVAITYEQLNNLVKMIPQDKQFRGALEHVDISSQEGNILDAVFNDGHGEAHLQMRAIKPSAILTGWRDELRQLGVGRIGQHEMVFNRSRLKGVLNALELACKYDGEFSYIVQRPFENGYVWRCVNELTEQTILIIFTMPQVEDILKFGEWEQGILNTKPTVRRLTR